MVLFLVVCGGVFYVLVNVFGWVVGGVLIVYIMVYDFIVGLICYLIVFEILFICYCVVIFLVVCGVYLGFNLINYFLIFKMLSVFSEGGWGFGLWMGFVYVVFCFISVIYIWFCIFEINGFLVCFLDILF